MCVRVCVRERGRERETDRETERDKEREREQGFSGLRFKVSGFRGLGVGFKVSWAASSTWLALARGPAHRVTILACRVSGMGFRVLNFGFRVLGLGFRE